MSKEHFPNANVAAMLAKAGWGNDFESEEDAQAAMIKEPGKVAAWGIIELLRRLNSLGDSGKPKNDDRKEVIAKPANAKAFPDKKVGEFLYSGDIEDGVSRYLIASIDENGFAVVVRPGCDIGDTVWGCGLSVACDWHYATEAEVVARSAENDIEYHLPMLERARKALKACESGGDLTEFLGGEVRDE